MFKIGNIVIKNRIVLAPMAGISNSAFIRIAEEMGLGLAYTELISAEAIVRNNKKTLEMLKGIENLSIPVGIQLFGSDASKLALSAKMITEMYPNAFIDINMGCPVPKVAVRSQAGASLLKNVDKIYEIVSSVVWAVNVPVTVKIRSGWDLSSINALEVAKVCERAGAVAITVHGRTRSQGYSGHVDLDIIKGVKENVKIPVIGNGDVKDIESAKLMFEYTKCDALMIGRGVLGNPWLIKDLIDYFENGKVNDDVSYDEIIKMCLKHLDYLIEIKGERIAIMEMRSQIAWYVKGLPDSLRVKKEAFKVKTKEDMVILLNKYLNYLKNGVEW